MPAKLKFSIADAEVLLREGQYSVKGLAAKLGCQITTARVMVQTLKENLAVVDYELPEWKGSSGPVFTWKTNPAQKNVVPPTTLLTTSKQKEAHAWKRKFNAIRIERDRALEQATNDLQKQFIEDRYEEKYKDLIADRNDAKELQKKRNREVERIKDRIKTGFFSQEKQGVNLLNIWNPVLASNDQSVEQQA